MPQVDNDTMKAAAGEKQLAVNLSTDAPCTPIDPRTNLPLPPGVEPPSKEWDEVDAKGQKWHCIQTKSETFRQPVAAARSHRQHPRLAFIEQQEDYLKSHGWKMTGINEAGLSLWQDPISSANMKPEVKTMLQLPLKGGGLEDIKQLVVPPLAWDYPMQEAMQIQWQRDESSLSLDQIIANKEAELKALYKQREERDKAVQVA